MEGHRENVKKISDARIKIPKQRVGSTTQLYIENFVKNRPETAPWTPVYWNPQPLTSKTPNARRIMLAHDDTNHLARCTYECINIGVLHLINLIGNHRSFVQKLTHATFIFNTLCSDQPSSIVFTFRAHTRTATTRQTISTA